MAGLPWYVGFVTHHDVLPLLSTPVLSRGDVLLPSGNPRDRGVLPVSFRTQEREERPFRFLRFLAGPWDRDGWWSRGWVQGRSFGSVRRPVDAGRVPVGWCVGSKHAVGDASACGVPRRVVRRTALHAIQFRHVRWTKVPRRVHHRVIETRSRRAGNRSNTWHRKQPGRDLGRTGERNADAREASIARECRGSEEAGRASDGPSRRVRLASPSAAVPRPSESVPLPLPSLQTKRLAQGRSPPPSLLPLPREGGEKKPVRENGDRSDPRSSLPLPSPTRKGGGRGVPWTKPRGRGRRGPVRTCLGGRERESEGEVRSGTDLLGGPRESLRASLGGRGFACRERWLSRERRNLSTDVDLRLRMRARIRSERSSIPEPERSDRT